MESSLALHRISEFTQHFTTVATVQATVQNRVHVVTQKPNGAISQQNLSPASVPAARSEKAGKVHNNVRDPAVWRVVSVGERAHGTGMSP